MTNELQSIHQEISMENGSQRMAQKGNKEHYLSVFYG